jgi:hypothetical protein
MKNKNRAIFFGVLGMIGGFIVMGIGFSTASNNDMHEGQIAHSGCTVTDKPTSQRSRGQAQELFNYYVDSACGKFKTNKEDYNAIEIDHTYDFTTTKGSWGNHPTLVSFTETH